jgi:hypothetical protein
MGRSMFEPDNDNNMLIAVLATLNEKLANARKLKTVEELQKVINDLTVIIADIKKIMASY